MRSNGPGMAEGISKRSVAIAVELVLDRTDYLRSVRHGAFDNLVDILDVEHDADWRTAVGFRTARLHLGEFVGQHDRRIANFDFRMADRIPRPFHAKQFRRSESLFVKLDCLRRTFADQVRGYAVISIGNRFD